MSSPEPPDPDLHYRRVFDAPPDLVFRCMIEPEHLTHFWGPAGTSAPIEHITVDPRPGGVFETVMVNDADGARYQTRSVFTEVRPPHRLAWIDPDSDMATTIDLADLGDGRTEVHIHQVRPPETFRTPEAIRGFTSSLDRLAEHLATVQGTDPSDR